MTIARRTTERGGESAPRRRILIADDDPAIGRLIKAILQDPGYELVVVADGLEALRAFEQQSFDLVFLDIMMPYVDGFEACQRIRAVSDVPIVIITSRDGTDDVVHGFGLGADEYVTKPFKTAELQARVEAILRRSAGRLIRPTSNMLVLGDLQIDAQRHVVSVRGKPINLTPMEFDLLSFLANHAGTVFDRETLFREVWGYEYVGETNLVDVCVRRLREKVELEPSRPRMILTVRGIGYKLAES
jgi:DNA-binding response OmpR family regulator